MAISFEQYGGVNFNVDSSNATYGRVINNAVAEGVHPFYFISNNNYYLNAKAELDTEKKIQINTLSVELGFYNGSSSNQNRKGKFRFLVDTKEPSTTNKDFVSSETSSIYECDFSEIFFGTTPSNHQKTATLIEGTGRFQGETLYVKIIIQLDDGETYSDGDRFGLTFLREGTINYPTLYTTFEYNIAEILGRVFIKEPDGNFYPYLPYIYTSDGWQSYNAYLFTDSNWNPTKYTP